MPDDFGAPVLTATSEFRYRAFLSYSHADMATARRLHRALESYRIPAKLVGRQTHIGKAPRRLGRIFKDREELPASADLASELDSALRGALFLLVVCSPAAARSPWVEQEILRFKRMHGEDRILALVVAGEPHGSSRPETADAECFPRTLRFKLGPTGELSDVPAEPIAADLRPQGDGPRLARLKLVAGLTGLPLDDLVQRETQRRMQRLAAVAGSASVGMVAMGGLALYANSLRIEANVQRAIAVRESAAARAASDYLVGTFELSNPATENPRTITALTILGRSAERARTELAGQPQIQSRLLATLGKAYNNLGLLRESRTALEGSLPQIRQAGPDGAEAMLTLADAYAKQGATDAALAMVREAEAALGPDRTQHTRLRGMAAVVEGRILTTRMDVRRGIAAFDRGLAYYRAGGDTPPMLLAVALNNRGLLLMEDGQFAAAKRSLEESLVILRRLLGDEHLLTGQGWYALAQTDFMAGDLPAARARIARAVAVERRVLENDNPILADSLSLQGQIDHASGRLEPAKRSLAEAIEIYRRAYGGPHHMIGIAEVYAALIQSDQGNLAGALALLADAKHNYDVGYGRLHANHGDLLVYRAQILGKAGRRQEARADCAAGVDILRRTLGPAASYTRTMEATCAKLGGDVQTRAATAG